jgi:hypothetical protein
MIVRRDWLLHGAIQEDEKLVLDLVGPGYHINRSNLLVLESKADMQNWSIGGRLGRGGLDG